MKRILVAMFLILSGWNQVFAQEPTSGFGVSLTYIDRFNEAAKLAREGKSEAALSAYESIFQPLGNSGEKEEITWNFFVEVNLRKAYCLMDLNRFQDAWLVLESADIKPYVSQIHPHQLYAYYFSLGNILGNLGKLNFMSEKFKKAIRIAGTDLRDPTKELDAWSWLFQWGKTWQKWDFLGKMAWDGLKAGFASQNEELLDLAEKFLAFSYKGKGQLEKALERPQKILKYYKNINNPTKVTEWEHFIPTLTAP